MPYAFADVATAIQTAKDIKSDVDYWSVWDCSEAIKVKVEEGGRQTIKGRAA